MSKDVSSPNEAIGNGHGSGLWNRFAHGYRKFQLSLTPQQNLLYGFLMYTLIGSLLLCLPWVRNIDVSFIDNLFMATSAISTTGLAPVSTADSYNWFGQFIIMVLIQIGGIGYMTFSSYILLAKKSQLTHWHQRVLNAEFAMPKGFHVKDFLKSVIVFTVVIELLGALCFYIAFVRAGVEPNEALWSSIFHSVSSFCTAGFGLYNDSFVGYADHTFINVVISVLCICGSMGFIVVTDFWQRLSGRTKALTHTTKTIIGVTTGLLIIGTALIYFLEPTVVARHDNRLMVSFFQAMTALTTVGFNTIPLSGLSMVVILTLVFLMYVGASPAGTGGGLKSTTFVALIAIMWNRIRNNKQVIFLGRVIPVERLYVATSVFIIYATLLFMATFLLALFEDLPLSDILFETTSAIGTVGLSTGITGALSDWSKAVLIFIMFAGRLGVLTLGLAILAHRTENKTERNETDLAL